MPNGPLMNGHASSHDHDVSTAALLRSLKPLLDPTADTEVPANVEEAALDAVGRLGSSSVAASLFFVDELQLAHDVATIALGRAGAGTQMISLHLSQSMQPTAQICQHSCMHLWCRNHDTGIGC